MSLPSATSGPFVVDRYTVFSKIASGGMASVHLGRLVGPSGFARTVAIKRMLPHLAQDPEFASMFLDEARLAARIRHPNVVPTLDVVASQGELFLVMEYVQGETLARLQHSVARDDERIPLPIVAAIVAGVLHGLHAAHEARNERGEQLGIVHRDVSPQNILVGVDGVARVLDFGVAKAIGRLHTTRSGQLKGKIPYMAPELLKGSQPTRRSDIFSVAVVLWEVLTGSRLFEADNDPVLMSKVLECQVEPPSSRVPDLPAALDAIVMCGLEKLPEGRFPTARAMASALEDCLPVAIPSVVGAWVESKAGDALARQANQLADIESSAAHTAPRPPPTDKDALTPALASAEPTTELSEDLLQTAESITLLQPDASSASQVSSISVTTQVDGLQEHQRRMAYAIAVGVSLAIVAIAVGAWLLGTPLSRSQSAPLHANTETPVLSAIPSQAPEAAASAAATQSAQSAASVSSTTTPSNSVPPPTSSAKKPQPAPAKGGVVFRNPG